MSAHRVDVPIRGLCFECDVAGAPSAPLVLLLHGFPQTSHTYRHELPALASAGFLAVAPNQRGYSAGDASTNTMSYAPSVSRGSTSSAIPLITRSRDGDITYDYVCTPVYVIAYARDANGSGWSKVVRVMSPDGQSRELVIPSAELGADFNAVFRTLANEGLETTSDRRADPRGRASGPQP